MTLLLSYKAQNTYGLPTGQKMRRELKAVFGEQRRAVLRWLRTGTTKALALAYKEDPQLPAGWPDWDSLGIGAQSIADRMTPLIQILFEQGADTFGSRVGLAPIDDWSVVNPEVRRSIENASLNFAESTNATTSMNLADALQATREALADGLIDQGETLRYLTDRINEIFDGAERYRAQRIAATEASRAFHAGAEAAAIKSGVVTGWKWLLSGDACPLCQSIAASAPFVKLGQPFAVYTTGNPAYASVRYPPAHPNCQCTVTEVLDIDEQPGWSNTLTDPEPLPEGEVAPTAIGGPAFPGAPVPLPKPGRQPKPGQTPRREPKPAPEPVPAPAPVTAPVSDAIDLSKVKPANFKAKMQEALNAIDEVHRDGNLKSIPLVPIKTGDALGNFRRDGLTGNPIDIQIRVNGPTPRLTALHEIGHFIDWQGIPKAVPDLRRSFWTDRLMEDFMNAVERSEAYKKILDLQSKTTIRAGDMTYTLDQKYLEYMARGEELWARAYAQYIAIMSRNKVIKAELEKSIKESDIYPDQWTHKDFEPIAREMDKIFRKLGWQANEPG